jgi:hypothetical protein
MNPTTQTTARPAGGMPQSIMTRQGKQQHRGYTPARRALAHHQQAGPTTQVQRMPRNCRTPLGVRLTTATLHQLAVNSTVRHPVEIPRPSAVQLVRMSCCDTGWGEVDHARCSHRTGGCGHVFDAQLWDAHRPARMCVDPRSLGWCTPKTGSNCGHWTDCATNLACRAGQTEKPRLCVGVGVRRSGEVSGLNGDRQGRGRSPPARVGGGCAASVRRLWVAGLASAQEPRAGWGLPALLRSCLRRPPRRCRPRGGAGSRSLLVVLFVLSRRGERPHDRYGSAA